VTYDAVIVGSGPNGLTAAALLAAHGLRVIVLEAAAELGGGLRSQELTLPGFTHDVCSAVHTMGCLSPAFAAVGLEQHGLEWITPPASVAHPLDEGPSAMLQGSVAETAAAFGQDSARYRRLLEPWVRVGEGLIGDVLAPLSFPRHPFAMARLGYWGLRSATALARSRFSTDGARALFAGCAAHSILPLDRMMTSGVGLVFLVAGHLRPWPVARGGSVSIARALESVCRSHGVVFETNTQVTQMSDLPDSQAVLFDLAPKQVAAIAGSELPSKYLRQLSNYRMGPGVFKVDWALDGPIPWRDPECARASTVHVGGSLEEIAASERQMFAGECPERPFLIVTQQSHFDDSRAPTGKHTGYAYCHVPAGCTVDMTAAIEAQLERFAPGFRERVLARHTRSPAQWERYNPSYLGGAISGGVNDLGQFISRPALRFDPYSTPNRRLFLCSQSTPPGGGVHGMCGLHGARSALCRVFGIRLRTPLPHSPSISSSARARSRS
jgi:phytoene dehydrogenase-like protein